MKYLYRPGHLLANENGMVKYSDLTEDIIGVAPYTISDEMEPLRHMADGKHYTSKAKFRETTKAYGCVEYGNELPTLLKPRKRIEPDRRQRRNDIRRAIDDLRNNRVNRESWYHDGTD